jgi:outer membrane protein assembly factor BamB
MTGDSSREIDGGRRAVISGLATAVVAGGGVWYWSNGVPWRTHTWQTRRMGACAYVVDDVLFDVRIGSRTSNDTGFVRLEAFDATNGSRLDSITITGEGTAVVPGSETLSFVVDRGDNWSPSTVATVDTSLETSTWDFDRTVQQITAADSMVYVGTSDLQVHALSTETGIERFTNDRAGVGQTLPFVDAASTPSGVTVLKGRDDDVRVTVVGSDGEWRWDLRQNTELVRSVDMIDDTVYVEGDELRAFDADSGEERFSVQAGSNPNGPQASVAGHLCRVDAETLVGRDPQTGEERWQFPTADPDVQYATVTTPPVPVGDAVVVGTLDGTYEVDATTGESRWHRATDADARRRERRPRRLPHRRSVRRSLAVTQRVDRPRPLARGDDRRHVPRSATHIERAGPGQFITGGLRGTDRVVSPGRAAMQEAFDRGVDSRRTGPSPGVAAFQTVYTNVGENPVHGYAAAGSSRPSGGLVRHAGRRSLQDQRVLDSEARQAR